MKEIDYEVEQITMKDCSSENYNAKVETPKKESWLSRVWNTIKWIFSW